MLIPRTTYEKKSKQGIWGDKNEYPRLYKSLGIEISLGIPKVKIT
jgi:hypothetical protein